MTGKQSGSTTTITFTRKLNTGDKYDVTIPNSNIWVIWAVCTTDGTGTLSNLSNDWKFFNQYNIYSTHFTYPLLTSSLGDTYPIHTQDGSVQLNLFTGAVATGLNSGELLIILTSAVFVAFVAVRTGRKVMKKRRLKKALAIAEQEAAERRANGTINHQVTFVAKISNASKRKTQVIAPGGFKDPRKSAIG